MIEIDGKFLDENLILNWEKKNIWFIYNSFGSTCSILTYKGDNWLYLGALNDGSELTLWKADDHSGLFQWKLKSGKLEIWN